MQRDDDSLDLPAGLKAELRGLYAGEGGMGAERDAEILRLARSKREAGRRWIWRGAVAAGILLAVGIGLAVFESGSRESAIYVRTGDVRDAFYLARELKGHQAVGAGWDVNHDGVVDGKDVESLAMGAVRVGGAGGER